MEMLERVKEYVTEWHMLEEQDKVIVGVSGGADSVCLLLMLLELRKQVPFEVIAVHVNHELRGEAATKDEAFVRELCKKLGVECVIYSENIELIAKNRKQSTEEAGRDVRYEKFELAMGQYSANKLALAHHKNDNVETLLMNLARGTGLKGMGGIRPVNGTVIRPLLCLEREEIEAYLKEKRAEYCIDQTNATDDYTRNKIRNHVIPYMEQYVNSAAVRHMDEAMQQLRETYLFVQEQMLDAYETYVEERQGAYLIKEEILGAAKVLKSLVLKEVLIRAAGKEKDIAKSHIQDLQELFGKQTGRKLDLPYGLEAKRCYEGVQIAPRSEAHFESLEIHLDFQRDKKQVIIWEDNRIRCRLMEQDGMEKSSSQKGGVQRFDYDIIQRDVCIRTRKSGDYITIHPDGRTQKIKSFFINEKIPSELRDDILLVADGNHILWIVGYRTNCMYQVHEHTKRVLEIQIDKGE